MAKYILIGGHPHKAEDDGKALCEECVLDLNEPVKILICLFARPKKAWSKVYDDTMAFFKRNLPLKDLKFEQATENNFLDEINRTDIIFFVGGDTSLLVSRLQKNNGWQKTIKNKVVAGSSAGADILSKYNYDLEKFECSNGFGLVPVKTIVHFNCKEYEPPIGWHKAHQKLKEYKEDLQIWRLKEGEFKTYIQ